MSFATMNYMHHMLFSSNLEKENEWFSIVSSKQRCCPYLPLFHGRLVVLQAVWGKVEDIVLGRALLAFHAVAALAQDYILDMLLLGNLVVPQAAGDMAPAPLLWLWWWSQ